ncbi:hypothetical protein LY01_02907 [Nonlabens xylanidelens]|uniref:Outer membrane protein with beta-barrel domain n=1 Tax=Nonlabens xylanidelens TaxID=191564 RepID=A0A2S6IF33_9FLAO|nr:hypothetical protein [Nonlabens xylanidelens]PPK92819.1 hypothetical protein LY01_02907 [Nonlabens xylanidelens]PQJ19861.1 hypothetical protein BST94_06370 [Nonlabens xylanidelens]
MKAFLITTIAILAACSLSAQDYYDYDEVDALESSLENSFLKIGVGYWLPNGELSQFIDNSPLFELAYVVLDSKRNRSFELGIQLAVPQQKEFFLITDGIEDFEVEATSVINGYIKFNKYIYQKSNDKLGLGIALGIASIFVDPLETAGTQALDYDSINSVLIAPGLSWDHTFNDSSMVQFSMDVQYTPFKMERAVTRNLNSFSIVPKIAYRF